MKYALFLGCTIPARARNYELAARRIALEFGIELIDIEEFSCCGFPVKSINGETSLLLSVRNLSLAEKKGLDICTLCSACTVNLTEANKELKENSSLRDSTNNKLGKIKREYQGKIRVRHFARILYEEIGLAKIKEKIKKDLSGLTFAAHYGCHYIKPSNVYDHFDDPEHPRTLDELIAVTGAKFVHYDSRKQCCGGALLAVDETLSLTLAKEKIEHVKNAGADAITLVCPFCSVMYDDNQKKIESTFNVSYNLPVLYYPQVLGLALGIEAKELGLNMNRVKTAELINRLEGKGNEL
ncbi:MAG: CoB--CoM heterodisulfide reductase iron-sulfur subunit B family protein [Candidatus Aerophobetes bacterium]